MTKYAFVDQSDGYYETDASDGQLPEWTKSLISCPVRPANVPDFASLKAAENATWLTARDKMCGRLASIASRLYASDPASSTSCDAVATSLLGLFTAPAVVATTDITAYKLALKTRYTQAILLATIAARAEFGRYDK